MTSPRVDITTRPPRLTFLRVSTPPRTAHHSRNFHRAFPSLPTRRSGPTIQTMSALLTEPLTLFVGELEFDAAGNETPYLFHPTDDTTRCLPSSQWSSVVKACFKKHSPEHVAPPPKLLRAR